MGRGGSGGAKVEPMRTGESGAWGMVAQVGLTHGSDAESGKRLVKRGESGGFFFPK
jgi:hypothetical protein